MLNKILGGIWKTFALVFRVLALFVIMACATPVVFSLVLVVLTTLVAFVIALVVLAILKAIFEVLRILLLQDKKKLKHEGTETLNPNCCKGQGQVPLHA